MDLTGAERAWQPTHWVWLLTLFTLASLVEAIFWGQMGAFTPLFLPRLGIPARDVATWTGAIVALSAAAGIPLLQFWGALADRYARQPVIIRSFVAHLIAGMLAMLAGNVWVFILARAVMSFSLGNNGLMMTTLAERAPRERTGLTFSIFNSAAPAGSFVGPLLGGPVVDTWGFRALLGIDAAFMLLVVLGLSLGYRDIFTPRPEGSLVRMAGDSVLIITRSPRLRTLFPALFIVFAGWMLAMTYVPLAVAALYAGDTPGTAVGVVLGAGGLTALLVIGPLMGGLADRFGAWRVLFIGTALAVLLWPLPALTRDLATFTVCWTLLNGVVSGVFALSFTVLSRSTTAATRGRVMSFSYLPVTAGSIVGPALGSLLTQGSVFAIFPGAAALTASGLFVLSIAWRQRSLTKTMSAEPS